MPRPESMSVPERPQVPAVHSVHRHRFVDIDGIRTHYLDAGEGPVVVLLHSGEFGACAELSWEYVIPALADSYRVIAPDWLGFGQTDKVHDFISKRRRMLQHMARFVQVLSIGKAHFVGNSMGATYLLGTAALNPGDFPLDRMVIISGGGFVPDNPHRQMMLSYDCSQPAMVRMLQALFTDSVWWLDETYVRRRRDLTLEPGAWEAVAAARLRNPLAPPRSEFGRADTTPYEQVTAPTLIIAGGEDKLRLPGYAAELGHRIPGAEVVELPGTGHCPNIERAHEVTKHIREFLAE